MYRITILFVISCALKHFQNATMATRIKSIEITTANLVGEKTHLMAEVDKLRDQRARLEQVCTDFLFGRCKQIKQR